MTMSSTVPANALLSRLSGSSKDIFKRDYLLTHIPPARPSPVSQESENLSLGQLNVFPPEIVSGIFGFLDFQSLSRMTRVSRGGKVAVETMLEYRNVMQHAAKLLTALSKTKMIRYHSAMLIHLTVRSDQCVSCSGFGGFVFLPTCERACYNCLDKNHAFWMIPSDTAARCFRLEQSHLQEIPAFHTPTDMPLAGHTPSSQRAGSARRKRQATGTFVSLKQAKQMGVKVHGTVEKLAESSLTHAGGGVDVSDIAMLRFYRDAPLEPPGRNLPKLAACPNMRFGRFESMASLRVPHLAKSGEDWGRLCLGCCRAFSRKNYADLPPEMRSKAPTAEEAVAMTTQLRSRGDFIEHVKGCYGVQKLL